MSLCLQNDHSKDVVFTWFLFIKCARIRIDTRRKMAREEKHWEVGNSNMIMYHKKDGKLWLSYLQCRGEIQMKNLLIIVFCEIDNKKIEEAGNGQKTLIVTLFDFAAFGHHISLLASTTFGCNVTLWAFAPFGHSSCGRLHSKFSKLKERKRWQWYK